MSTTPSSQTTNGDPIYVMDPSKLEPGHIIQTSELLKVVGVNGTGVSVETLGTNKSYVIDNGVFKDNLSSRPSGFNPNKHPYCAGAFHTDEYNETRTVNRTELEKIVGAAKNLPMKVTFRKKNDLRGTIYGFQALADARENGGDDDVDAVDEDDVRSYDKPRGHRITNKELARGLRGLADAVERAKRGRVKELLSILENGPHRELRGAYTGSHGAGERLSFVDFNELDRTKDLTKSERQVDTRTLEEVVFNGTRFTIKK